MSAYNIKSLTVGDDTYNITMDDATQSASGLMSATDKTKLDGIDKSKVDNLIAITSEEITSMFNSL